MAEISRKSITASGRKLVWSTAGSQTVPSTGPLVAPGSKTSGLGGDPTREVSLAGKSAAVIATGPERVPVIVSPGASP